MSVFSKNPFDLLGDGDAPSAPVAKPAAAPAPAPVAPAKDIPGSKPPARGGRGGGYAARGGPRNVLKADADKERSPKEGAYGGEAVEGFEGERRAPSRGAPRARGEGRGRGGPRGRGGRGGGAGGEPRKYDNNRRGHAGAHGDSEKKVNSGWGAEDGVAELNAEVEGEKDAEAVKADTTPATPVEENWDAPEGESKPAEDAAAEPAAEGAAAPKFPATDARVEEEEDNSKTYEEYLAERAASQTAAGLAKLDVRTVNEGTSDFVGKAIEKKEEVFFAGKDKKDKPAGDKPKSGKKEKTFIEFDGKFAPPSGSDRGGRGGRGGASRGGEGRGGFGGERRGGGFGGGERRGGGGERGAFRGAGRGRGGAARGGRSDGPVVKLDDEKAFPTLGA